MKIAVMIARIMLGAIFFVFGLNGFLAFIPAEMPEGSAGDFFKILVDTKYIMVVKVIEVAGGALVLSGKYLPIGLCLLGPVIVNIFLFHALMAPEGLPIAILVVILEVFLIWAHKDRFLPIFKG